MKTSQAQTISASALFLRNTVDRHPSKARSPFFFCQGDSKFTGMNKDASTTNCAANEIITANETIGPEEEQGAPER